MPFIQENKIELNLGLNKEYKLIHISDCHAFTSVESDTKEAKEEVLKAEDLWYKQRIWFAKKGGEICGDEQMIPSKECLNKLVNYINDEEPDCAVLSGDIIDYYSKSNYELLIKEVNKIKTPYIFSNGNHDSDPSKFLDLVDNKMGFSVVNLEEFKLVSINNSSKSVSKETLDRLKEELKDNMPTIVVMHIPVVTEYNQKEMANFDPYFAIYKSDTDDITKEFINLLVENINVKATLCGHAHAHSELFIAPNKLQCIASSGLIGFVNKITVK